jgi:outer membrane protein OmpA-like peptidoglycan-associated protein
MTKIKITAEQYNKILLHESKTRLKAQESLITETLNEDAQLLEEGWKEVVLGIAMMMGVGLTGLNKATAQTATKNAETMAQIKSTLEDETKMKHVVDLLKQKGMKDPETKLANNAEKVMDTYNRIAADDDIKYKVDVKVVNNLQALKGKVGQGYALKGAEMTQDTIHQAGQPQSITVTDTLEIDLGTDNLFITGGFTLSPAGVDTIATAVNEIKSQGGKIESVEIESSTDAEEIVKFKSAQDPTGNIQLSNLRTQSVVNEFVKLGVTENITHREIPNNGSSVVSTQDFLKVAKDKKATAALREKTSEFRYVKIKIVATFETQSDEPQTVDKVIQNYRFELVKVIESTGKTAKIKTKTNFKHKNFKCHKKKRGGRVVDACSTF